MNSRSIATLLLVSAALACAADCPQQVFDAWLACRITNVVTNASLNARDPGKQAESPAIASTSTSLVDRSSGTDLIGAALNISGLNGGSGNTGTTGTVTASWYAVATTITHQDPLDPAYYDKHAAWRRVFFTAGSDSSSTSGTNTTTSQAGTQPSGATSQAATSSTTTTTKTPKVAGIQVLLVNKRDLSANQGAKDQIREALAKGSMAFGAISHAIDDFLIMRFDDPAKAGLSVDEKVAAINRVESNITNLAKQFTALDDKNVDALIQKNADAYARVDGAIRAAIQSIRMKPQLSILGQGRFGDANGNDEYRGEIAFDMGIANRLSLTLNGSFDYLNSHSIGADTRGGRAAGSFQYQFTNDGISGRKPVSFEVSGEGDWLQNRKSAYIAQAKLTIPIFEGVELPISFTYASASSLIKEKDVQGKIGFTFDVATLAKALVK